MCVSVVSSRILLEHQGIWSLWTIGDVAVRATTDDGCINSFRRMRIIILSKVDCETISVRQLGQ
jgi:hypothetical protein